LDIKKKVGEEDEGKESGTMNGVGGFFSPLVSLSAFNNGYRKGRGKEGDSYE